MKSSITRIFLLSLTILLVRAAGPPGGGPDLRLAMGSLAGPSGGAPAATGCSLVDALTTLETVLKEP